MPQKQVVTRYTFHKYKAYIKLLRPKQWIKNLFLFAAVVFSDNLFSLPFLIKSFLGFMCFCAISSCVYILNDIIDVEKDRHHPKKRLRPIASGIISKSEALLLLCISAPIILFLSLLLNIGFGVIVLAYFLINILYTFKVKHIVILDIMFIAAGFILRVSGGAVIIGVEVSPWILMCTLLLALFLGFSKRRNELVLMGDNPEKHRKILEEYSIEFLDNMLAIVTSSTVMAYSLYTFWAHDNKYSMITIPFVLYGIFRYQYLIYKKNEGGSAEEVIFSDKPFLINILLWVVSSIIIQYLL